MEFKDHDYTNPTHDKVNPLEFTYKMNSKEIEAFVKLRVSNNYLFSGRRNTSMWAWRTILRHMGLQHKMTHGQASKKWDNMKKRYKELKNPPDGVKVFPEAWPYFNLMEDAMEGRLEGSAAILKVFPNDKDSGDFLPISKPKKRKVSMVINSSTASLVDGPEIDVSLNRDDNGEEEAVQEASQEIDCIMQEVDDERNVTESQRQTMEREKQVMDREKQVMDRERLVLQRERAVLDRGNAALDRDRASLERERAMIEREKAVMERERAMLEKDRDTLSRARLALEREKAKLERLTAAKEKTEEVTEDSSEVKDSDVIDRKERFLYLFEKLVENF
ncbi:caldesmon [Chaetodon trifascialis]|uniref:caldesmon n=1 Tax=Chaetodon trifascialis TaxID=109706 RepID=UPI003991733D